jgi:outer membrane protein TolC
VGQAATEGGEAATRDGETLRWWTTFEDPTLVDLVESALRESLDVRSAIARVRQARALAMQARAARMPQIGFQAAANASHTITGGIGSFDAQSADASLPMSYEVDLFARRASEHHAARHAAEAS